MRRATALFVVILLILAPSALSEDWAFALNGEKVSSAEAAIYVYNAEASYAVVAEYYERYLGVDFWSLEYDNGLTVSETVKADVFKNLVMMNIFYRLAVERGMSLNSLENEFCKCEADAYWSMVSETENLGFTYDDVLSLYKKQLLAELIYESEAAKSEIDENAVIESIDKEACISYEVEYLCARRESAKDGFSAEVSEALSEIDNDDSFLEFAEANPDLGVMYFLTTFTAADENVDRAIINAVSQLEVGEMSNVIETDYGLFLMRLIDNTDTCAYDETVKKALYEARTKAYKIVYDEMYNLAEYEINVDYWDSLALGTLEIYSN